MTGHALLHPTDNHLDHQDPVLPTHAEHQHRAISSEQVLNFKTISDTNTSVHEGLNLGEAGRIWRELAASEMRISLMDRLQKHKVGLNDVENFRLGVIFSSKTMTEEDLKLGKGREIVKTAMKFKRQDEVRNRRKLLKLKVKTRKKIVEKLGARSNQCRKILSNLNQKAMIVKRDLKEKYELKINHLKDKHQISKERQLDMIPRGMEELGEIAVLSEERWKQLEMVDIKVEKYGEVEISEDEMAALRMHPKMAVIRKLREGYLALNQDISYTKLRMSLKKEEEDEEEELGPTESKAKREKKEKSKEESEKEKLIEEEEAKRRQVYNPETKEYDEGRWRVTDMPECARVTLPKPLKVVKEAEIEMRREIHNKISKEFRREKCDENGSQEDNLTKQERRGIRSLLKRREEGEIVIVLTDKSGKLCVMTKEDYLKLGEEHVKKDKEIGREQVRKCEAELNSQQPCSSLV